MPLDFQRTDDIRSSDPFRQETIELLRSELAQLEQELADWDATLAERAMAEGAGGRSAGELPQKTLTRLRQQITELQQNLSAKDRDKAALEARLASAEARPTTALHKEEIDKQMREERLRLAHERA